MCGFYAVAGGETPSELVQAYGVGVNRIQQRGQCASGASWSDGVRVHGMKGLGLISQLLTPERLQEIEKDAPLMLIAHTRYSTAGGNTRKNAQPHWYEDFQGRVAYAGNGDMPGLELAKQQLSEEYGAVFHTENDAEFLLKKIATFIHRDRPGHGSNFQEAITKMMETTMATYSGGLITGTMLYVFRDPWSNRPLWIGRRGSLFVAASETAVFNIIGAKVERAVRGGELIMVNPNGEWTSVQAVEPKRCHQCIFEEIYFGRPDSRSFGKGTNAVFRRMLGIRMTEYEKRKLGKLVDVDCVVGVPESSLLFSESYAYARGLPFRSLFVRDMYVNRTFITSGVKSRRLMAQRKYETLADIASGIAAHDGTVIIPPMKRVVIGEDSIVRLTTMLALIEKVREAGIEEIHVRISSPPIVKPCHFGIDMKDPNELIAAQHSEEEIRAMLGVSTCLYLPAEELDAVIVQGGRQPADFCRHCFGGDPPFELPS